MAEVTKRTVTTDALETLGTIIDDKQKRDAIHIAVLPAVAAERLLPGQDVAVEDDKASRHGKHVGIVDPFLKEPVREGERFWLLLYPRMVTSLRHVWSHPHFVDENEQRATPATSKSAELLAAEGVLDRVADAAGLTRSELIEGAKDYQERGEYMIQGGRWEGFGVGADFWPAYDLVTGETTPEDNRDNFFSCSC